MRPIKQSTKNKIMAYIVLSIILALLSASYLFFVIRVENKKKPLSWRQWINIGAAATSVFIGAAIINWLLKPTLAYDTYTIYVEFGIISALLIFFSFITSVKDENKVWELSLLIPAFLMVLWLGTALYQWDWFHTSYRRSMLQVTEMKSDSIVSPIPVEKMCIVSPQVAERVILTKMGNLKNTYEIGEMTKQSYSGNFEATLLDGSKVQISYKDQLVYIAVLEHKSFWTWKKNPYSPAYVLVDASDEDKAYVITEVNGNRLQIRYTPEAFWGCNLERYMRSNGYVGTILDDFNVEIDENGRPFAPVTTLKNSVGASYPIVTGVAVVDMQTGDIRQYTPENAPAFVNRIQPEWLIYDYLYCWGDYKNGYWHWSDKDGLLQACKGMDIVQTPNGCYYYVGIQAQTDSVGTQGYMLIDIRTGKANYFRRSGISETEAIRVLEANTELNLEMNQGVLELTEPIFYNIKGLKTYFATYVSTRDYMVKYYGFCSTEDKSVWGYGKTLEEAKASYLESYYKNMSNKNVKFQTSDEMSLITIEGEVLERVQEGNAYYFRLSGEEGKTFYAYSSILPEVRWEAHRVKITYNKTEAKIIAISHYEKLE